MSYTYKYARPALTTDCVVFTRDSGLLKVLLVRRKYEPFKGKWALPGGFMNTGKTLEQCVLRELEEETGLTNINPRQLHAFSSPDRDPREHVVSVVFYAMAGPSSRKTRAGDDAAEAEWFDINNVPPLAFDHANILLMARKQVDNNPANHP